MRLVGIGSKVVDIVIHQIPMNEMNSYWESGQSTNGLAKQC